jgi:hypothetical protein
MAHPYDDDARKSHGRRLNERTGKRGEYPPDRAERIAAAPGAKGQGDSAQPPQEQFIGAPARQVSNTGKVRT